MNKRKYNNDNNYINIKDNLSTQLIKKQKTKLLNLNYFFGKEYYTIFRNTTYDPIKKNYLDFLKIETYNSNINNIWNQIKENNNIFNNFKINIINSKILFDISKLKYHEYNIINSKKFMKIHKVEYIKSKLKIFLRYSDNTVITNSTTEQLYFQIINKKKLIINGISLIKKGIIIKVKNNLYLINNIIMENSLKKLNDEEINKLFKIISFTINFEIINWSKHFFVINTRKQKLYNKNNKIISNSYLLEMKILYRYYSTILFIKCLKDINNFNKSSLFPFHRINEIIKHFFPENTYDLDYHNYYNKDILIESIIDFINKITRYHENLKYTKPSKFKDFIMDIKRNLLYTYIPSININLSTIIFKGIQKYNKNIIQI